MAGWLSDEDLNCFYDEEFVDLLESQEPLEEVAEAKSTSSDIADLEQLSRSTEVSSFSRAALTKHLKVNAKSATLHKQPIKVSKSASVDRQMNGQKDKLEELASSQVCRSMDGLKSCEIASQFDALSSKEVENVVQDIKKRVQMIKESLTFTKSLLTTLIRKER